MGIEQDDVLVERLSDDGISDFARVCIKSRIPFINH